MKNHRLIATMLVIAAAGGVAHAGSTGAGPAASATPAVGSTLTPGSHAQLDTPARDDNADRVPPGDSGAVVLSGEQLARTAEALRKFEGAFVENHVIKARTVLADGTPAVIALNTRNGRLMVTRRER